jgi:hypothetical protein
VELSLQIEELLAKLYGMAQLAENQQWSELEMAEAVYTEQAIVVTNQLVLRESLSTEMYAKVQFIMTLQNEVMTKLSLAQDDLKVDISALRKGKEVSLKYLED